MLESQVQTQWWLALHIHWLSAESCVAKPELLATCFGGANDTQHDVRAWQVARKSPG
jgi:hypothetical protein